MKRFAAITILSLFAAFGCVASPDEAPAPADQAQVNASVFDRSPEALEAATKLTDAVQRNDVSVLEQYETVESEGGNVAYLIRLPPVTINCDIGCLNGCGLRADVCTKSCCY